MTSIQLPSLQFLFSTELRANIMYDALCDANDEVASCVNLVTEPEFDLKFMNIYQFNWYADGGWLGISLGDAEPTEENLLNAPTVTINSDDDPELHTQTTLPEKIVEGLEMFIEGLPENREYTDEVVLEELVSEAHKMVEELKVI